MANPDFTEKVYDLVRKIPSGRVCSYGIIARYVGAARSARLVGWALNRCGQIKPVVPAHRVVNRKGILTGKFHFGDGITMQNLLESEGIEVIDDQIQNFDSILWDPFDEL